MILSVWIWVLQCWMAVLVLIDPTCAFFFYLGLSRIGKPTRSTVTTLSSFVLFQQQDCQELERFDNIFTTPFSNPVWFLHFFPPGTRISERLRFLRCAPVQLPGQGPSLRGSSAYRSALLWEVQGKVPGHEQVARFGSWCLVPPVWVPQGSPLVPPELIWILSWQRVNNLVKYAFSVLQFNQD